METVDKKTGEILSGKERKNSLYEISMDIIELDELMQEIYEETELPKSASLDEKKEAIERRAAVEDAILSQMEQNEEKLELKVNNYCKWIAYKRALSKSRADEANRILALSKEDLFIAEKTDKALKHYLELLNIKKLDTPIFKLQINKQGGREPVVFINGEEPLPEELPEEFQRVKIEIDKTAIYDELKKLYNEAYLSRDNMSRSEADEYVLNRFKYAQLGELGTYLKIK
jgi:hypothetical protein